jgi:hypothetical protein
VQDARAACPLKPRFITDREIDMRLDHVNSLPSTPPRASGPAKTATDTTAPALPDVTTPTAPAAGSSGATFSFTGTWEWSASLQVSLTLNSGSATTPATVGAPDQAVGRAEGERHGRPHVSQMLRQLSREVRHELRAIIQNNPDLDPTVREELRDTAKAFRDDLRTAFHEAGRGNDFDPAALMNGVQQALATLADRLGALIGEETATPEPLPAPAPEPMPERPSEDIPTEMPVSTAA